MNLDETIAKAKKASENQCMNDRCRENFKQLAAWLEELKQYKEENQPGKSDSYQRLKTNLDHYKQEVLENYVSNLAVVDGRPKPCTETRCSNCEFNKKEPKECHKKRIEWLKKPYIKPTYKLTKFEKDLLQSYSNIYKYKFKAIPVLVRIKEKGYFKGVDMDATIGDILADYELTEEE